MNRLALTTIGKCGFVVLLAALFLFPGTGVAQSSGEFEEIAGTTPDSVFYGLDVALDRLSLALQLDDKSRAERGLEIARERLSEVKVMLDEKKIDDAGEAELEFEDSMRRISESVSEIERDNSTEEIRDVIQIKKELKTQGKSLERVRTETKIKIETDSALTAQQRAQINAILDSLSNQTGRTEIEIEIKENETKIKIKQETGKGDDEIDDEIEDIEDELSLKDIEVKAEIIGGMAQIKIENDFTTNATERNAIIDEILQRFALDRATADRLLKIESDEDEDLESERLKIKAEAEAGATDVEVELRFTINATGRDAILSEIVSRTRLSRDDVSRAFSLGEIGDEKERKVRAEVFGNVSEAKVEIEFVSAALDRNAAAQEILNRMRMNRADIDRLLRVEVQDEAEDMRERLEAKARVRDGASEVEAELRFRVNATDRSAIAEAIFQRLSALTLNDILSSLEFREDGVVCIQVITPAKNPATGECKEFSTPCGVPAGWVKVDKCAEDNEKQKYTVDINSTGFYPSNLTISKGDTVIFVNQDTVLHWPASAQHPAHAVYPEPGGCIGSKFDACKGLEQGEKFEFEFKHNGTWQYHDHLNVRAPFFGTVNVLPTA